MPPSLNNLGKLLKTLHALRVLTDLDVHLLDSLVRTCGPGADLPCALQLALALTSRAVHEAHVCLDLDAVSEHWVASLAPESALNALAPQDRANLIELCGVLSNPDQRQPFLEAYPRLVGGAEDRTPFVLDGSRLYLRRYWCYEQTVATTLVAMAKEPETPLTAELETVLNRTFDHDEQRRAARKALTRRLCVITGGPGTGKTHAAARILDLLAQQGRADGAPFLVRSAAPTGKAAARMQHSLRQARAENPAVATDDSTEHEPPCTIERLLGYKHGSPYFRHNADHPLQAHVVLVDEASMIDMPKMAKLLDALGPTTRLILLGDMHQLASVQPGSVLADLCQCPALRPCVAILETSRRFGRNTAAGRLIPLLNSADTPEHVHAVWTRFDTLARQPGSALTSHGTPEFLTDRAGSVNADFAEAVRNGYAAFRAADTAESAFAALARFRVICAMRRGPFGTLAVNRLIEKALNLKANTIFYPHRVVMVTRNDYALGLFNGDVGVVLPQTPGSANLTVFFEHSGTGYRQVSCRLLPVHETAFAMTVHKSQGSEFTAVLLILPNTDNPVLTREMMYTGMTRMSESLALWVDEPVFKATLQKRVQRFSGLSHRMKALAAHP